MAKKKSEISKSDLIRKTAAENPTAGPTEVARMIETAHKVSVSAAMVSTVLSQDRARGGKPAKRGRPPKSAGKSSRKAVGGMSVDSLLRIKQLADEMGGIEEAKRALDALSQILG